MRGALRLARSHPITRTKSSLPSAVPILPFLSVHITYHNMESISPFEEYFDSDYAATAEEIPDIKKMIDKHQAIVDDIDARIEELNRQRQELEDERKGHAELIARLHNLTTVVRGVPTDILSTIFITLLSMSPSPSSPHPSIAISHVCHQCRRLALAMPLLWTRINLSTPKPSAHEEQTSSMWMEHVRSTCERATAFIHRAGANLLNVEMVFQDPVDDAVSTELLPNGSENADDDIIYPMSEAVKTCDDTGGEIQSARLSLKINSSAPVSLVYTQVLPLLKYADQLTVEITYMKIGPVRRHVWESLENSISFVDFSFTSLSLRMRPEDMMRFDVNWETLTDLSLTPEGTSTAVLYAQHIIPILTQATNLNRLSLGFRYFFEHQGNPLPSQPPTRLPKLRTLELRGDFIPLWFMTALDIPSVTHLSMKYRAEHYHRQRVTSPLVALLQECGHQILYLSFEHNTLDKEALPFALGLVPNVEVLEITASYSPSTGLVASRTPHFTLKSLYPTQDETKRWLVPNLEVLICDLDQATSDAREDVLGLVQARRKAESAGGPARWIKEVEVRFRKGSVDGMLEELRDRGVNSTLVNFKSLGR